MFEQITSVVFILVVFALLFFGVRLAKGRASGLRRILFGAEVIESVGEVEAQPRMMHKVVLRVHRLGFRHGTQIVGVEVTSRSFASFQITPVSLTREQAATLVELLKRAMDSSPTDE